MRPAARSLVVVVPLLIGGMVLASRLTPGRARRGSVVTTHAGSRTPGGQPITGDRKGLEIRLSDASPEGSAEAPPKVAKVTPLSDAEAERLLARLPPLDEKAGDRQAAAMPPRSLPPPRAGVTRRDPFPPPRAADKPPEIEHAPLQVLRHAPEGDVPLAARVAITFSQPMVAVTSHDTAVATLPAKLTPLPPGAWRWAGSQLLIFEGPEAARLPMATRYEVEISAGTRSATGNALEQAHRFAFTTPPPALEAYAPTGGAQPRDPLILMRFDQRIDAATIAQRVTVSAAGANVTTRRIDGSGDSEDARALRAFAGGDALVDRVVALRATAPLPYDSGITVTVPAGTPSAEGPLTTTADLSFSFQTYGPLKVTDHRCTWDPKQPCRPEWPWSIVFSNPLDDAAFDIAQVAVTPKVEELEAQVYGNNLQLTGRFVARTKYVVTLSPHVRDVFGQELGDSGALAFDVGPATPQLTSPTGAFTVLDPDGPRALRVYSAGLRTLKVALYRVEPERDWARFFLAQQERWQRDDHRFDPPGQKVSSDTITVAGDPDALTETSIDLTRALKGGLGSVLVVVEPGEKRDELRDQIIATWAQSTRLGLSAFVAADGMLAWATELKDGKPAAGVELTVGPGALSSATSAGDGTAHLALPYASVQVTPPRNQAAQPPGALDSRVLTGNRFLLARRGDDVAFLPENAGGWWDGTTWREHHRGASPAWHVFDDRGLYRPGETARVKGIVRSIDWTKGGDVGLIASSQGTVFWTLADSVGNQVSKGSSRLTPLGGFDISLELPKGMNLGESNLTLGLSEGSSEMSHAIRVEEFRRPEYEVSVRAGEGPFVVGGDARVTASALYYAGGPLPDADVHWRVTATPGTFQPPHWDEFLFGEFTPWWGWTPWFRPAASRTYEHDGRTNASGEHAMRMEFLECVPPRATSVDAEASVQDVNRQAWSASASLLVHPSDAWVGLRAKTTFVERGEPLELMVVVVDRDGKPLPGTVVSLHAARLAGRWSAGGYREEEKDAIDQDVTSGDKPVRAALDLSHSGSWTVTARVLDAVGRPNETVMRTWVSGDEIVEGRSLQQQQAELIPDKKEHAPGETAKILVRAPFSPAEALLTVRRSGIVLERRFRMESSSQSIELPIEEGWLPAVDVQVDLVGRAGEGDAAHPATASGSVHLAISKRTRTLDVAVSADDEVLSPGASTTLRVKVTDGDGRPASGEVTLVVADESVLALTGYQLADPLVTFYPERGPGVTDYHLRTALELRALAARQQETDRFEGGVPGGVIGGVLGGVVTESAAMGVRADSDMRARNAAPMPMSAPPMMQAKALAEDKAAQGSPSTPIALRKILDALALFEPALPVGPDGTASVALKLPDSLTRYRVMAVAVSGPKHFGKGESSVTARKPLMVRPSLPRFLNFGDRAELPVVIQNQTGADMDVSVALRASNATVTGPKGFRVRVPHDDRVEVRFPATTENAGTARVQAVAASGDMDDAAELSLPIWTPATTEAFATYGTLDAGAVAQPVAPPPGVLPQFGELSLETSSTALFEVGDALLALWRYPFECSEQVSSRLLGVCALRDAVGAFSKLPPKADLDAAVGKDIQILVRRQSYDGRIGLWRRGDDESREWPWVSVHAAHALALAKAKGYDVPEDALQQSREYLRQVENHIPRDYPDSCRRAIVAHALFVRRTMGDADPKRAASLVAEIPLTEHAMETLALVLPTLWEGGATKAHAQAIVTHFRNHAAEEAGTISFAEAYGDADWLVMHSSLRTDAIILLALLDTDAQSDMVPKLMRGLLEHRLADGAWSNTQENCFSLLALDRYFHVHEAQAPDFHATAWIGDTTLASQDWRGRSTERRLVEMPMQQLVSRGPADVVISKEGTGRLYWRLGMTYVPQSLKLDPSQHGFVVERAYEGVDDPKDAWRDDDGAWHFKSGALVRSRVTMVATARRTHVALVDPLPAGVEAQNPALATTGHVEGDTGGIAPARGVAYEMSPRWWWGPWFEHQNLRDERAEAFSSYVPAGAYEYAWVGRATTPGTFVVPPAKAEEMYHPETFGRTATDRVIVE